jgi:hypothetical protein
VKKASDCSTIEHVMIQIGLFIGSGDNFLAKRKNNNKILNSLKHYNTPLNQSSEKTVAKINPHHCSWLLPT